MVSLLVFSSHDLQSIRNNRYFSRMDYNHAILPKYQCDGYTIAEVYNDNEYGNKVILYESNKCDIELGVILLAVLDFCSYYIKKSIPKNYLVRYIEIMHNKKQFIFQFV